MAAMGEAAPTGPLQQPSGHESAPPVPELPALLWKATAPEGEPGPAEIDIIVLHGGEKGVVRCPSESTFVSLKMGIQEATGLPSAHQRLIFNKKQRKDVESFAEAGVAHQSKVRLLYSDQFALTREGKAELSGVADEVSQLEEEIPRAVRQAEQRLVDYASFMVQLASYEDTFKRLGRDLQNAYKGDASSKELWQETQQRLEKLKGGIAQLRGSGLAHLGGAALT